MISFNSILILNSIGVNKHMEASSLTKNILINIMPLIYSFGINTNINYKGEYKKSNKVDILISNHINAIDFMIYLSVLRQFDDREIYFIMKKDIMFIPGFGSIFTLSNDIKLNKKIEDDMNNIINTISKIKEGIIIIMPEGTRFSPEKQIIAKKYSQDNNLPYFNNTLYPKMKGLFLIANILNENNKLGNIIDFTIYIDNIKKDNGHIEDVLLKNINNSYCIINNYNFNKDTLNNYNDFKKWFLDIWKIKDNLLDNNNNNDFIKIIYKLKLPEIMVIINVIALFFHLIYISNGKYLIVSCITAFLISFIKYKELKKFMN